jgi:hypothetical protein
MKNLLRFLAFVLMVGGAYAQSKLPACQGRDAAKWSDCFGTVTLTDGDKYIGEFKDGKENGQGTLTYSYGGKYVGAWKNGEYNGQGTYTHPNGDKYVGGFLNGSRHGKGTLTDAKGHKLVAEFKNGEPNGQGTFTSVNGSKYVGEFKNGEYNGQGTYTYVLGNRYVGEWKDGKENGRGTFYAINGSVTSQGIWADGKLVSSAPVQQVSVANQTVPLVALQPNISQSNLPLCQGSDISRWNKCFGTSTYANGDIYVGEYISGWRYGKGTLFTSNGSVINHGVWDNDKFSRAADIFSVPSLPVPNIVNQTVPVQQASAANQIVAAITAQPNLSPSNLPACPSSGYLHNCFGTQIFPSGMKYVGEWKYNKYDGQGTWFYSNGSTSEGIWRGGVLTSAGSSFKFAPTPTVITSITERDRLTAEVEAERNKRQELEQQLASNKERERITSELDLERKKRQELEAQLAASVQPTPPQTNAPRRTAHALVIGNAAYPGSGRLDNPVNDANAISLKLRSMGFTVTTVTDANRQRLVQSMAQFRRTAASADISLLYYAGHGVQIFGTNYILPTDVDQTDPAQATIQGVSLNSVVENFLPGKTKLVFLDACRDNALQRTNDRSVSKGLAPISAAQGTLISYATKDGQTAADGVGSKNSPFTQALLEHLNDPQDIAVVLRKVRERVMKITGGKQQPWEYGNLTGGELVLSAIKTN